MLSAITSSLTSVLGWMGTVVQAFVGEGGALVALLPVVCVSIALGLVGFGIRTVKSLIWGF